MKRAKLLPLALAFVLLLSLLSACSSEPKIDPQYYEAGKQALAIAEAYLADRIDLAGAKARAAKLQETLDALPLIPENDPTYEQSENVILSAEMICFSFRMQNSDKYTLALHEELEQQVKYLNSVLGLS